MSYQQHVEYNKTSADRQKLDLKQQCLQQYYRYLNLLKRTDNFRTDPSIYKKLNDSDFDNLAIVGWLFQMENIKIKANSSEQKNDKIQTNQQNDKKQTNQQNDKKQTDQTCLVPIVHTSLKYPFKNYQKAQQNKAQNSQPVESKSGKRLQKSSTGVNIDKKKSSQQSIKRRLLIARSSYTKYFVKPFNQIIRECKQLKKQIQSQQLQGKQIQWIYCFSGLKVSIYNNVLYLVCSQTTKVCSFSLQFYFSHLLPLQQSLYFSYSYLSMPLMPRRLSPQTIAEGFSLAQFQSVTSTIQPVNFTGILKTYSVDDVSSGNAGNRKHKEVVMQFVEDGLKVKANMIGTARMVVKLGIEDSVDELKMFFKLGYLYLVTNANVSVSDSVNIIYKLKNKWQQHVVRFGILKNMQITHLSPLISTVTLSTLKLPSIFRNIMKFRIDLIRCEYLFGKVICSKCKNIMLTQNYCNGYCGKNQGQLSLWALALVTDQSSFAEASFETKQCRQYFQFTQLHLKQIRKCIFHQGCRKMVKLFSGYEYFNTKNRNDTCDFQHHLGMTIISKSVLAIPRYNLNQSFNTELDQQDKIQFQTSLQTSKQYMKRNKIHFNGYIKKIQKNMKKVVSFIKVSEIVDL